MIPNKTYIYLISTLLVLSSCRKDFGEKSGSISVNVSVVFEGGYGKVANAEVKLTSKRSGRIFIVNTDANGVAHYENLISGDYDVEAHSELTGEEYKNLTSVATTADKVFFNGYITSQSLKEKHNEITVNIIDGIPGDWLIKQVYYGGSDQWDGANFRDQFIEFYNNTDSLMYADSLYFAQVFGENSARPTLTDPWYLPSGQLDWRLSTGMANANTDYVYAYHLYMVPGTGRQYPVNPGESIVIAQNALNHKAPYVNNEGHVQTVNNPSLTIDLSNADFEAYLLDYRRENDPSATPYRFDIDNPLVPNIKVLLSTHDDMILDNLGRDAYIIFKASDEYVKDLMANHHYPSPKATQNNSNKNRFIQIPTKIVIDGVELAQTNPSSRAPKRLPATLDGGFTYLPKGYYRSQSVIRKTVRTVNGRKVLMDTNNSSNDFQAIDRPLPKGFIN